MYCVTLRAHSVPTSVGVSELADRVKSDPIAGLSTVVFHMKQSSDWLWAGGRETSGMAASRLVESAINLI